MIKSPDRLNLKAYLYPVFNNDGTSFLYFLSSFNYITTVYAHINLLDYNLNSANDHQS